MFHQVVRCGGGDSWREETEIELVVGGGDDVEDVDRRRSRRRHVFEGLDLSEIEEKKEREGGAHVVGGGGRLSMCSPPKNALLLMRCRSDPVKVAALANRVRERQLSLNDGKEEEEDERRRVELDLEDKKRIELCEKWISGERQVTVTKISQDPLAREEEQVREASVVEVEPEPQPQEEKASKIEATFMKSIKEEMRNAIEEEEKEYMAKIQELAKTEEEEKRKREEAVFERSEQGNREPGPSLEVVIKEQVNQREHRIRCYLIVYC